MKRKDKTWKIDNIQWEGRITKWFPFEHLYSFEYLDNTKKGKGWMRLRAWTYPVGIDKSLSDFPPLLIRFLYEHALPTPTKDWLLQETLSLDKPIDELDVTGIIMKVKACFYGSYFKCNS